MDDVWNEIGEQKSGETGERGGGSGWVRGEHMVFTSSGKRNKPVGIIIPLVVQGQRGTKKEGTKAWKKGGGQAEGLGRALHMN